MDENPTNTNWFTLEGFVGLERQEQQDLASELLDLINGARLSSSGIERLGKRGLVGEIESDLSIFIDNLPAMELRRILSHGELATKSMAVAIPTWCIDHSATESQLHPGTSGKTPALTGALDMRGISPLNRRELDTYNYVTKGLNVPENTYIEVAISSGIPPYSLYGALALVSAKPNSPK